MINLSTKYMGLELKNPIIVGSSRLTNSIENIKEIAKKGAGAVVLKSIFDEQIKLESEEFLNSDDKDMKLWNNSFDNIVKEKEYYYEEAFSYISNYAREKTLSEYLKFVTEAKKAVDIPIIASIHCISQYDWQHFAKRLQEAGADAIELNVYILPSDFRRNGEQNEQIYFDLVAEIKKYITIPFALKIGYYFSGLANTLQKLSETGTSALVLFNRPYNLDIDINKETLTAGHIFSSPEEQAHTLRWIAIMSGRTACDLSASTGIHDAESAIKQLLAGASTIQIASTLYKNGFDRISEIVKGIETWMTEHNYSSIDQFRGKLSQGNIDNPAAYERVQFMKLYSHIE